MKDRFNRLFLLFLFIHPPCLNAQLFSWAVNAGGETSDAIAVDTSGNVFIAGAFTGSPDFDPGPGVATLSSAGFEDIYISKFAPSGALIWALRLGDVFSEYAMGIDTDEEGNVLLAGRFRGTVDFDPGGGYHHAQQCGRLRLLRHFHSEAGPGGQFLVGAPPWRPR